MANLLQILGLQSPGPGIDPNDPNAMQGVPPVIPGQGAPQAIPGQGAPQGMPPAGIVPGNIDPSQMTQAGIDPAQLANALQGLNGGTAYADPSQTPQGQVLASVATPAPGQRRSVLDTVGRLADVFARVGGAPVLYQPTIDARDDRRMAIEDRARTIDLDALRKTTLQQNNAAGALELSDKERTQAGTAINGLQALQKANPSVDISKAWPLLAAQAGIAPERAAVIGQALAADPNNVDALDSEFNGNDQKLGLQPFYVKDSATGKTHAFQLNAKGEAAEIKLPDGFEPVNPVKVVDTGGAQVLVDSRTGAPVTTIQKTEAPGKVADRQQRTDIANGRNATTLTVAGMPARAKGDAASTSKSDAGNSEALIALDNLENGFKDLHNMNALPGDNGGVVNNVLSALGRTGTGQYLGEQAGSPAAQRRVAMQKTVNTLQQTLIKALPASATRTKFEQEILAKSLPDPSRMSFGTAQQVINDYRDIFKRAQAAAATSATPTRVLPPRLPSPGTKLPARPAAQPAGRPTVSNW